MSIITIDEFKEFSEDYPELAQCYTFIKDAVTEEPIVYSNRERTRGTDSIRT